MSGFTGLLDQVVFFCEVSGRVLVSPALRETVLPPLVGLVVFFVLHELCPFAAAKWLTGSAVLRGELGWRSFRVYRFLRIVPYALAVKLPDEEFRRLRPWQVAVVALFPAVLLGLWPLYASFGLGRLLLWAVLLGSFLPLAIPPRTRGGEACLRDWIASDAVHGVTAALSWCGFRSGAEWVVAAVLALGVGLVLSPWVALPACFSCLLGWHRWRRVHLVARPAGAVS